MGKGFNNYMCKKFFHPASRDNLKRVWMAEQKTEAYKKAQEELRIQYEKEQELHDNKAIISKESKDKLSVNFMYEPPPGVKKEREREDNEPEYKFEWQRKYNAPRESYCKGDNEIRDQPFGILVRNVRCIKCHKWGHINTDKECSMYSLSMSEARALQANSGSDEKEEVPDAATLVRQMRESGLAMKTAALPLSASHAMLPNDENGHEADIISQLSKKEKKRLLKKLEKMENKSLKKKRKLKSRSKSRSSTPEKKYRLHEEKDRSTKERHHSNREMSRSDRDKHYSHKDRNGSDKERHGSDKERHGSNKERHNSDKGRHGSDKERHNSDKERHNSDKGRHGSDKERHNSDKERHGSDKERHNSEKERLYSHKERKHRKY